MTFCLAFSATPDGIAVISDTRITHVNGFTDGFQKTFFPTDNSFIAVAGSVGTLHGLLSDLAENLQPVSPDARIDSLRSLLYRRARGMQSKSPADAASIIYGDVRMQKGPSRCRLARFDVGWSDSGAVVLREQSGENFAAQQATHFPGEKADALPWLCIGMVEGTRNFIGNTTMAHVRGYLPLGLRIVGTVDKNHIVAHGSLYQKVNIRASSTPTGSGALAFDMTGPEDGSFRRKLREYANVQAANGVHTMVDVINMLGIAALKRTEDFVKEIPGAIGLDTVSQSWSLATISRRSGIKLLSDEDANAVTINFGLKRDLI
jgi:hypothetical protein